MPEVTIARWRDQVRELHRTLAELDACPDHNSLSHQVALEALRDAVAKADLLCMRTAVLKPINMQKLIMATLDDGSSGVSANDGIHWASVTARLQLSREQEDEVLRLRERFLRRISHIMGQRRQILAELQHICIADTLKVHECTARLTANLWQEQMAGLELIVTVFRFTLSPLQRARIIVSSYPFFPDIYQISTVLAAKRAGASGLDLLVPQQHPHRRRRGQRYTAA